MVGITYSDYYIPGVKLVIDEIINNISLENIPEKFKERQEYINFCKKKLRLNEISVENNLKDYEMVERLVKKMLDKNIVSPSDVDYIILAQERFNYLTDNLGQYIQYECGLNNATIFNISGNHCSNVEMAILIAKTLLNQSNNVENILIISLQIINEHSKRIVGETAFLGDGAGILLLSKENVSFEINDLIIINNGYFHDVKLEQNNFMLHYKYSTKSINMLFKKNKIEPDQVSKVIIQNINLDLVLRYFERFGLKEDKFFLDNIGKYGHLTCIDIIANLTDFSDNYRLEKGSNILTFGMGWAGSYSSMLITFQ